MKESPVEQLLDQLHARLHARRTELLQRVDAIEAALAAYRTSAEQHIAHEFAVQHSLNRPGLGPLTARQAAERLYSLVTQLPELVVAAEQEAATTASGPPPSSKLFTPAGGAGREIREAADCRLAALVAHSQGRKLVVLGALAGRSKQGVLPTALEERTEWVDTERDGVHAIGNLPQRVRQQRVAGIVILDRAVQHKHTDPVLAAARDANTEVVFAGQGGRASLIRALEQLDERLRCE